MARTDGGVALVAAGAAAAEGHAVQEADVVADHGGLADHDARRVVHQDAAPDPALRHAMRSWGMTEGNQSTVTIADWTPFSAAAFVHRVFTTD